MNEPRILGTVCAFILTILSTTGNASLVMPAGLNPGDIYHVIFISSTMRDATSSNIADYDAHVQAAADAADIGASINLDWRAIGSTASTDAYSHLASLFTSTTNEPIYNQFGHLVSASFDGLWDGALNAPVAFTETTARPAANFFAWTGTNTFGNSELTFGAPNVTVGIVDSFSSQWVNYSDHVSTSLHSLYALSGQVVVVPAPPALWLFGSGLLGLVGAARRKKAGSCRAA